jgi:hypothetical protein
LGSRFKAATSESRMVASSISSGEAAAGHGAPRWRRNWSMATLVATRTTQACRPGWPASRRQATNARANASAAASSASAVVPINRRVTAKAVKYRLSNSSSNPSDSTTRF